MAPKPGATIKGKQAAVQEGQFLQFLRSVGYKDDLPPSTVAWLETAPLFRFLAKKLSHDNFVSPEDQQEYNEVMLAMGPNASLYDGLEGLNSDDPAEDGESVADQPGKKESDPFLADDSDEEVARKIQEEEAYVQQLEQQISALRGLASTMDASSRKQAEQQPAMYFALKAQAANELSAVRAEAMRLNSDLNDTLAELSAVASELTALAAEPQHWLLSAADREAYNQQNEAINELYSRAVTLLDIGGEVTQQLFPGSSSPVASPIKGPAPAAGAGGGADSLATLDQQPASGVYTPRGGQQQQQPLTPRGALGNPLTSVLLEARNKRYTDQQKRNAALMAEVKRQRQAFALAYQGLVKATVQEAGVQGQLAAAHEVRSRTGEFARLLQQGPSAIPALNNTVNELEATKQLLERSSVANLVIQLARLNDNHIIVGDYDRQLAKMEMAKQRKWLVLRSMLSNAAQHLLLLALGLEELQRLAALGQELHVTADLLEGHVEATRTRINRCVAAHKALVDARQRSNLQAEDTFLCTMLAAAEGNWDLEEQSATAAAAARQQHEGSSSSTGTGPQEAQTPPISRPGSAGMGARTPSYAPTHQLTDKLQGLARSVQESSAEVQRLLDLLPQQLEQHKDTACQLHCTAFPPGQPSYTPGGGVAVSAPASAAGSTWGGSQSAATSIRSTHSTNSGTTTSGNAGQHLRPLLTLPEVAEAQVAFESCLKQLHVEASKVVAKHNEMARGLNKEKELERQVMVLFFQRPDELAALVDNLRKQVQQLQLEQALGL